MSLKMVEIQPLRVEVDREDDGRFLASIPDLPGVMAYGETEDAAVRKAKSIALQVLADMIESGEEVPESTLRCVSVWRAAKARRVFA
jgi:predicted RNase H-like HicB family nuclease